MRAAVQWVSARPQWVVLGTIICGYYLAPVAGALLIVYLLRHGPAKGLTVTVFALVGTVGTGLLLGRLLDTSTAMMLGFAVAVILGGAGSGWLLGWSRSLTFAFQTLLVSVIVGVVALFTLVPSAGGIGELLQADVVELLRTSGVSNDLVTQFAATDPSELVRVLLISLQLSLLTSLMLGLWWYSLIAEGLRFGREFRALKLGRSVGIALMLLVVAAQLLDAELIAYVAPLAVIGFLFQGLAVLHARNHRDKWPRIVLVLVYVALFSLSPLTVLVLMGLSAIGLLDNFFELRARPMPDD